TGGGERGGGGCMKGRGSGVARGNIAHLKSGGKIRPRRIPAASAADGEVQDDIVRLMKGILAFSVLVKRVFEVGRVQQDVVNIELDGFIIPIHPPDMKLLRPFRVVEFGDGLLNGVPLRRPAILRSPGNIGQEYPPI